MKATQKPAGSYAVPVSSAQTCVIAPTSSQSVPKTTNYVSEIQKCIESINFMDIGEEILDVAGMHNTVSPLNLILLLIKQKYIFGKTKQSFQNWKNLGLMLLFPPIPTRPFQC